jgi:hypothetical protein
MIERRALSRIPLDRLALLHVSGIRGVHPCLVKDINTDGACLSQLSISIVPDDFALSFDGFRTTENCHIVWRKGALCGVRFSTKARSQKS